METKAEKKMSLTLLQAKERNNCIYFRKRQFRDYHLTSPYMSEFAVPLPNSWNSMYKCIVILC
jgi:hypothetical protein